MARILYLVHRMPYPPNKGDKVRSYHLLRHLAAQHQVFVGTFIDDPDDAQHVPTLRGLCAGLHVETLHPKRAKLASLGGLLKGEALTLGYYRSAALQRWVDETVARERIDAIVVFSSSMAPYALRHPQLPCLVDFVDVDSAKWAEYADRHPWPMSWLYRREGRALLDYERSVCASVPHSFFVTDKEVALFARLAPESASRTMALGNGVDTSYFTPDPACVCPFASDELPLVFTGAMDYWPNVDAVVWFTQEVLPQLRQRWPKLVLSIVGRSPVPAVRALAGPSVRVTGTVDDVRPWLQHASVVVAPLRLARGVQNKVLEAMAMAKPVVAAHHCVAAITALPGQHIEAADDAQSYLARVSALLVDLPFAQAMGRAARECVQRDYAWQARLAPLDALLPSPSPVQT